MAMIYGVGETWQSVATAAKEGWQCRKGIVLVSTDAAGGDERGIQLHAGQAWAFPTGTTVYYRSLGGGATIAREVMA